MRRTLHWSAVTLLAASVAACGWYNQAISGHSEIMRQRQPVADLLADPATPDDLRNWLALSAKIRDFASRELDLPDNDSYRLYADLERDEALWIVVAAPEFSLTPKSWCYLFVGCQNYRGYFSRPAADRKAGELADQGFDTAVLAAGAYSTLGWFADPLLASMRDFDDWELGELIFHELAHQELYIDDDTRFNESFADFVAATGAERWFAAHPDPDEEAIWRAGRTRRERFHGVLDGARRELAALYAGSLDEAAMRREKQRIIAALHEALAGAGFKVDVPYNNARLANEAVYRSGMAQFAEVFAHCQESYPDFYRAMRRVGHWPQARRQAWLDGGREDLAALCKNEND